MQYRRMGLTSRQHEELLEDSGERQNSRCFTLSWPHVNYSLSLSCSITQSSYFARSSYYRMIEWLGWKGLWKSLPTPLKFQSPCHGQGQFPLYHVVQDPIQPDCEYHQGWDITTSLGGLFQCVIILWARISS